MSQPSVEVEIVNASGALRVTINHKDVRSRLLFEVMTIGVLLFLGRGWPTSRRGMAALAVSVALGLIAAFYRLVVTEVIAFSERQIMVCRTRPGWTRTSEYALDKCSELEWLKAWGNPAAFRFKYGWRRVAFGKGLTWEQARRVLAELKISQAYVYNHLQARASLPEGFDPILHGNK